MEIEYRDKIYALFKLKNLVPRVLSLMFTAIFSQFNIIYVLCNYSILFNDFYLHLLSIFSIFLGKKSEFV